MDRIELFVSPDGNDKSSGRIPVPDRKKKDGPFATIERAKEEVRNLKNKNVKGNIIVYLRKGTYFLKKPLTFTSEDSGSPEFSVVYTSYKNEKIIISGGRRIKDYKKIKIEKKEVIVFKVPFVKDDLNQIFINGKVRRKTRIPEKGNFLYDRKEIPDDWRKGEDKIFLKKEILERLKNSENLKFVFMHFWVDVHLPVEKIDYKKGMVKFEKKSMRYLYDGDRPARFFIENVKDFSQKGHFYFDKKEKEIYYIPFENESKFEIVVPCLENLVLFDGDYKNAEFVEYVNFKGITFSHTNFSFDKNSAGDLQAGVDISGSVKGKGVKNISFENCIFTNLDNYAIEMTDGCKNNEIKKCKIYENGAGGIKIGEFIRRNEVDVLKDENLRQTYGNRIIDCEIYNCGKIFHQCVGILIGHSYNNLISGNEIYNLYYSGISVGWTWGYDTSLAYNNILEFNHIHHIGKPKNEKEPFLSDMGGIYTLGIQPGTILRKNIIHNVYGYRYGGWGIYLDEGSSEIIVDENIVYNTTHGGFHQHYGKNNLIRNNIFAFGKEGQLRKGREEKHLCFTFINNIVIWKEGELFTDTRNDFNFFFDRNVYWNTEGKKFKFGKLTFSEWKKKGMDKNSKISDPKLLNSKIFRKFLSLIQ